MKFPEGFDLSKDRVNDASVRLKIYRAYMEVLARRCRDLGLEMLLPLDECLDEAGFLREEHWQGCTHANRSYYQKIIANQLM